MRAALLAVLVPTLASAQSLVLICGTQALPNPAMYQLSLNDGPAMPFTMPTGVDTRCPAGSTHSFTVPADTVRLRVDTVNAFGITTGPTYELSSLPPGPPTGLRLVP